MRLCRRCAWKARIRWRRCWVGGVSAGRCVATDVIDVTDEADAIYRYICVVARMCIGCNDEADRDFIRYICVVATDVVSDVTMRRMRDFIR